MVVQIPVVLYSGGQYPRGFRTLDSNDTVPGTDTTRVPISGGYMTGQLFAASGVVVSGTLSRNGFNVVTVGDVETVTSTMIASGTIIDADVNISGAINATKLNFLQAGASGVARTVDSRLKDMVSVKDFGAVGDGVTDDTAAIQAAIDYAYTRKAPIALNAQPVVFFPAGRYKTTASLLLNDYTSLKGEGKVNSSIELTGTTNISAVRSIYGENPTYGGRLVGWNISSLTINGGSGTGAIGLNMRGVGYSTVTDVYALGKRYGLVTSNECYYVNWSQCKFYGDTAAYLQSDGGGNGFSLCDFNAEVICVDIESGTFDFFAGVMDVNTAGATHIIKLGRASGIAAVSNMFGVYVEGVSATTLTAEIGATTSTSGFFGMHRHNVLGGITNNASLGSFICIMTTGYFDLQTRTNEILLGDGNITATARAKIYSPSGNQVNFESSVSPGAFADHVYRTGKPQQGIEFPATQVAVVNANTLDDYEEGTWTPVVTGWTSVTYTVQDGKYIKIGKHLTAWFYIEFSGTSAATDVTITGLPFTEETFSRGGSLTYYNAPLNETSGVLIYPAAGTIALYTDSDAGTNVQSNGNASGAYLIGSINSIRS